MAAEHALAMGSALLRRFCGCGTTNRCTCGLDRPASGWTVESLAELQSLMRENRSLAVVAELTGKTRFECNIALDAMLGATPTHALARLEAQTAKNQRQPRHFRSCFRTVREQTATEPCTVGSA